MLHFRGIGVSGPTYFEISYLQQLQCIQQQKRYTNYYFGENISKELKMLHFRGTRVSGFAYFQQTFELFIVADEIDLRGIVHRLFAGVAQLVGLIDVGSHIVCLIEMINKQQKIKIIGEKIQYYCRWYEYVSLNVEIGRQDMNNIGQFWFL
eukprot:TRINITY_DN4292_c1_g1_i2.p2 TRINITY_DN4292_c1_g1~~TRINITY_DN4292_c1_g1_i2.p2  ORF type:complete len:151 (-),score=3.26 TRINITY_DN4292_c1_g1_i2:80-532(-)